MKRSSFYYVYYLAGFFLLFWIWPIGNLYVVLFEFALLTILFLPAAALVRFYRMSEVEKRRSAREYILGHGIIYCVPMTMGLLQFVFDNLFAGYYHSKELLYTGGIAALITSWVFCKFSEVYFDRLESWLTRKNVPIDRSEIAFARGLGSFCILLIGALQYLKAAPDLRAILDHNLAERVAWIFVGLSGLFYPSLKQTELFPKLNIRIILIISGITIGSLFLSEIYFEKILLICTILPFVRVLQDKLEGFSKSLVQALGFVYLLNVMVLWGSFEQEVGRNELLSLGAGLVCALFYVGYGFGTEKARPHFWGESFGAGFLLGMMTMFPALTMNTSLLAAAQLETFIEDVISGGHNAYSTNELGIIHTMGNSYGWLGLESFSIAIASGAFLTFLELTRTKNTEEAEAKNAGDLLWCVVFSASTLWMTSFNQMSEVAHQMNQLQLIGITGLEYPVKSLRYLYSDVPLGFYIISMSRLCVRRINLGRFRWTDGFVLGYTCLLALFVVSNAQMEWQISFIPIALGLMYLLSIRFRERKISDNKRTILDFSWQGFLSRVMIVCLLLSVYQAALGMTLLQGKPHMDLNLNFEDIILLKMRVDSLLENPFGTAQPGTFDSSLLRNQVQFLNKTFMIVPWTSLAGWLLSAIFTGWIGGCVGRHLLYCCGIKDKTLNRLPVTGEKAVLANAPLEMPALTPPAVS